MAFTLRSCAPALVRWTSVGLPGRDQDPGEQQARSNDLGRERASRRACVLDAERRFAGAFVGGRVVTLGEDDAVRCAPPVYVG